MHISTGACGDQKDQIPLGTKVIGSYGSPSVSNGNHLSLLREQYKCLTAEPSLQLQICHFLMMVEMHDNISQVSSGYIGRLFRSFLLK